MIRCSAISEMCSRPSTPGRISTKAPKFVVRTTNFGAFVEILPGVEGLLHISEIAEPRIKQTTDEIEEGDEVLVKVIEIDPSGKVRLSRKAAMKEQAARPPDAD